MADVETRRRPRLHFTAPCGFINDPHAVTFVDGIYHLFYQHNPHDVVWSPRCHWGHATSPTLVDWVDHGDVLAPDAHDDGVWSGAIAVDAEQATILYTSVRDDDIESGRVALARGSNDLMTWAKHAANPVLAGPPDGLDTVAFRDPFVWRDGDRWRMIMGTGVRGVGGAAVQYSSIDLLTWDGGDVIAIGHSDRNLDSWTGKLWECPQLFELDRAWILLVSVWDDGVLHDVAYAVGDYDGVRFEPQRWDRFSHGPLVYATTTFLDEQGNRCALSWLRERADADVDGFAGAHSMPVRMRLDSSRLVVEPHPDVTNRRVSATWPDRGMLDGGEAWEMVVPGGDDRPGSITLRDGRSGPRLAELTFDESTITVDVTNDRPVVVPLAATDHPTRIFVDADIIEVFSLAATGITAVRLGNAPPDFEISVRSRTGTPKPITEIELYCVS
jgi:beta-fructofuranosidase